MEFHPEAQDEFISAAQFYESQAEGLGLDFIVTVQRTYEPPSARWLDVGCGTGALTETILGPANPAEVHGIDPSEDL